MPLDGYALTATSSPFTEVATSRIVDLTSPLDVDNMMRAYAAGSLAQSRARVLRQVINVAIANGADTVLIEHRYVDMDWRSEYAALYAGAFRDYPALAHRLHFLSLGQGESTDRLHERLDDADYEYVGYSVVRPLAAAPVGRTMLPPPPELRPKVRFSTTEVVHLFGVPQRVRGVPFLSQDAQVARCAHAVAWQSSYFHHLNYGTPRRTVAQLAAASPTEAGEARALPSSGLVKTQLGAILRAAGIGPIVYLAQSLPNGESQACIIGRYLDSALPVIASSDQHAVMLLGCESKRRGHWDYVFHDDEAGPYCTTKSGADSARPWTRLFVPVPDKLYLPGEVAETISTWHIDNLHLMPSASAEWKAMHRSLAARKYAIRSVAVRSNDFKAGLVARGIPKEVASQYRLISMPRWIWVTEIYDPAVTPGRPNVVSELIVDATMHLREVDLLAWRTPSELWDFGGTAAHADLAGRYLAPHPTTYVDSVRAAIAGAEL